MPLTGLTLCATRSAMKSAAISAPVRGVKPESASRARPPVVLAVGSAVSATA